MKKEEWAALLGHQLKGIMLHSDMFNAAMKYKDKTLAAKHYCQALKETENFMRTNAFVIETTGEIIEAPQQQRITLPPGASMSELSDILLSWEMDTVKMYHKAANNNPDCKLLRQGYKAAVRELKVVTTF